MYKVTYFLIQFCICKEKDFYRKVFGISSVSNKSNEASKGWLERKQNLIYSNYIVRNFKTKLVESSLSYPMSKAIEIRKTFV